MIHFNRKTVKRIIRGVDWRRTPVLFSSDLEHLPKLPDRSEISIRTLDPEDRDDVQCWCSIMHDAFSRSWIEADFNRVIRSHPVYDILDTYLLEVAGKTVATGSIGVFRRQRSIGVTHYLGLRKENRGQGLGKYLLLHMLHRLRAQGLERCEVETNLSCLESIGIHFDFGFQPKYELDDWNSPGHGTGISRAIARYRMRQLYRRHRRPVVFRQAA